MYKIQLYNGCAQVRHYDSDRDQFIPMQFVYKPVLALRDLRVSILKFLVIFTARANRETFLGESNPAQTESNYQAMTKNNKYITSIDYINQLPFDYLETYSFCRGNEYDRNLKMIKPEYNRLRVRKEKRGDLTLAEEIRLRELSGLLGYIQYLLTSDGHFHPSAQKVNTRHCY